MHILWVNFYLIFLILLTNTELTWNLLQAKHAIFKTVQESMNQNSQNNNEHPIVFYFKKDGKPPRNLKPLEKPSEATQQLLSVPAFPSAVSLQGSPRLQPLDNTSKAPKRREKKQRHLVVKMPTVSYPGAHTPQMSQSHRDVSADSGKRVTFLPPIAVHQTIEDDSGSEQSGNNQLYVPDTTPDPKYESMEFQRRLSVDRPYVNVTYRKSSQAESRTAPKKRQDAPEPKPLRYVNKHNSLYNSWEIGLHSYHIHEEKGDDDEDEQLTFRLKMRQADDTKSKKEKKPPKDPFREAILTDIDSRRKSKIKEAVVLSTSGDLIKGKPVIEDPPRTPELMDMQRGSQGFHRVRALNLPGEYKTARSDTRQPLYLDGNERASALFQKRKDAENVRRPFEPQPDNSPRLLTGKTVLRNPLSPVPLKHRYNPVVVVKSKLDDYTGAIKDFLEQVVEEQRMAVYDKYPLPLSQSIENMVIYKDFDTIQYFKAMQKQLVQSKQHTQDLQKAQQYNFKHPSSNVAKGVAKMKKIGALNPDDPLAPLPRSGLKPKGVVGQSVFLTNPQDSPSPSAPQMSPIQKMLLLNSGIGTPTSAPPNTPHVARLC